MKKEQTCPCGVNSNNSSEGVSSSPQVESTPRAVDGTGTKESIPCAVEGTGSKESVSWAVDGAGFEKITCGRKKHRDERELRSLVNRLRRIEGQVRGVVGMVEEDAYCTDVLMQVSAIQSALSAFSRQLLSSHIGSCVVEDIKADREGCVEELIEVIGRFMK